MSFKIACPPELWDRIVDYLWDDTDALSACSLTCRAWVPRSRLHSFRSIRLASPKDYLHFTELLESSQAASTGIAHYVRDLSISSRKHRYTESSAETFRAFLPPLLDQLDGVVYLTLDCAGRAYGTALNIIHESPLPARVSSVCLFGVPFQTSHELTGILRGFPRLTSFSLRSCFYPRSLTNNGLVLDERTWLEELCIENYYDAARSAAEVLLDPPFNVGFRSLVWKAHAMINHRPLLQDYLRHAAPFLEHLSLIPKTSGLYMPQEVRSLALCTRLESLYVECIADDHHWIALALSSAPPRCLRQLTIAVDLHRYNKPAFPDIRLWKWGAIDEHLVRIARSAVQPVMLLELLFRVMPEECEVMGMVVTIADSLPRSQRERLPLVVRFVTRTKDDIRTARAEFLLTEEHLWE